ncbi:MAG: VWA domain-containing protein [Janthinobacterium lividum]
MSITLSSRLISTLLLSAPLFVGAQNPSAPQPAGPSQPRYNLELKTRLVVEDVIVTDHRGLPVSGLPQSSFHIQDSGTEQHIRDFAEHSSTVSTPAVTALPAGTWSNVPMLRNTGNTIAMLLDPVSMTLPEQMFLRLQMLKYLRNMPDGSQVAIFRANSHGVPILVQSLTTDRARLEAAVDASVPAILSPADSFGNAIAQLRNIADFLLPIPGKKVLLWFGGRFPLFLDPDACSAMQPMVPTVESAAAEIPNCGSLLDVRRDAYRALEQARIAVFPIDVRGVLGATSAASPSTGSQLKNSPGSIPVSSIPEAAKIAGQYDDLEDLAKATGGKAFYSTNDLAKAITSAVILGTSAYTLTWRPEPYTTNGSWHRVRISVDGGYNLSYRNGYFAGEPTPPSDGGRRRLAADGKVAAPDSEIWKDAVNQSPILFSAHFVTLGEADKRLRLKVLYAIPTSSVTFQPAGDGSQHARLRLFVLAYNVSGEVQGSTLDTIETHYTPAQMQVAARIGTPVDQTLEVGKAAKFLLLAVEDLESNRVGTLEIPLADVVGH